ncbi:MAG: LPP20 family lipoprotein [Treponema sp.]|jgi:hypothetical protein|nr:LPP20 family lipoprotein [Treponema sp.]
MSKIVKLWFFALAILVWCIGCAGNARGLKGDAGPSKDEPAWVSDVEQSYSRLRYAAAVGYGSNRSVAEKEAFANLVSVFGQTVQADRRSTVSYSEAMQQETVSSYFRNMEISNAIRTSAEQDTLIGAEIRDYWFDGRSTHYAVAVMERGKAVSLYTDLINTNREIISTLTTMDDREKNSLDGFARYHLAAKIADGSRAFSNILSVVGSGAMALSSRELAEGEGFRLEANNIAQRIPVDVQVSDDQFNRIKGAFAAVIGKKGFKSGGSDSRYVLNAQVDFVPVELLEQTNKYIRYTMNANLVDRVTENVLLPYTVTGREGHLTVAEAENRVITAIEKEIAGAWDNAFSAYLDSLLPAKK